MFVFIFYFLVSLARTGFLQFMCDIRKSYRNFNFFLYKSEVVVEELHCLLYSLAVIEREKSTENQGRRKEKRMEKVTINYAELSRWFTFCTLWLVFSWVGYFGRGG